MFRCSTLIYIISFFISGQYFSMFDDYLEQIANSDVVPAPMDAESQLQHFVDLQNEID